MAAVMMQLPLPPYIVNPMSGYPYRCHSCRTVFSGTETSNHYWISPCICDDGDQICRPCKKAPCICGNPSDDKDGGSCPAEQWVCRTCHNNPFVCNVRHADGDPDFGDHRQWTCHTCYTDPCVCGARGASEV